MKSTETFKEQVRKMWGKSKLITDAAFAELFRHGDDIPLDFDDQIQYVKQVGLLAGESKDSDPETFIGRFESEILNEE